MALPNALGQRGEVRDRSPTWKLPIWLEAPFATITSVWQTIGLNTVTRPVVYKERNFIAVHS